MQVSKRWKNSNKEFYIKFKEIVSRMKWHEEMYYRERAERKETIEKEQTHI